MEAYDLFLSYLLCKRNLNVVLKTMFIEIKEKTNTMGNLFDFEGLVKLCTVTKVSAPLKSKVVSG